jgi:serine/threonine protein kinase
MTFWQNLLIASDGVLKIADFGVSQVLDTDDDLITKSAGTPAFTAPECCRPGAFHGKLADLWAAGCTLYFFSHGRVPFMNPNVVEIYEDIQNKEIEFNESLPSDFLDLLKMMLNKDPEERLKNVTFAAIKAHPWMASDGALPPSPDYGEKVTVSEEDLEKAITNSVKIVMMVRINIKLKSLLSNARQKLEQRHLLEQGTAGMAGMAVKDSDEGATVETATPAAAEITRAPAAAAAVSVPADYVIAEDSDEDIASPSEVSLTNAAEDMEVEQQHTRKRRGGKCAQQ